MKLNIIILKIITYKHIGILALVLLIISCSTRKDKFVNRTFHAKTAKYNVLYNGNVALETGLKELNTGYNENFWEILPIEPMQESVEEMMPGEKKNPNFERAEDKAIKAIEKHSMNIGGSEKNTQMDEAYILLGKARYFENRFIPALEAFNYVLYKYPNSDKIYDAKVWREKLNIRLDNDQVAVDNLKRMLKDQKVEGQNLADANAMLAQAYINVGVKDTAIVALKIAKDNTKSKAEKARYLFIIGQLYEHLKIQDTANMAFQEVIAMKRKSPRKYVIQSQAKLAQQFDPKKEDTLVFLEKFNTLLEDRENRPFLDVLNHQMGLFYEKQDKDELAIQFYNKSIKKQTKDQYLIASNYRNIAEINFYNAQYATAGKYYDSTLTKLNDRTREYRTIAKKRLNLDDVIKYEDIVKTNDSIIHVASLSNEDRVIYYQNYIEKLKTIDLKKQKEEERLALIAENEARNNSGGVNAYDKSFEKQKASEMSQTKGMMPPTMAPPSMNDFDEPVSKFYFYNQNNIAFGKSEFRKKWGKRDLKDNWRWSKTSNQEINPENENDETEENDAASTEKVDNPAYKTDFYIGQINDDKKYIDSLKTERNFADFQLGTIYKEKFKEYKLAANKFEKLLGNAPEERLILPSKYNLYKIYQIMGDPKTESMKQIIISEHGDSRYAQIIQNPNQENEDNQSPEAVYTNAFKELENEDLRTSLTKINEFVDKFNGDEMAPKFELLKAQIIGRLKGVDEYKKALNFVALNYPNVEEGKKAEKMVSTDIPALEILKFSDTEATSWKIVFPKNYTATYDIEALQKKLDLYIKDRNSSLVKTSNDVYNQNVNFIVIHGFSSKEIAQSTLSLLKEYKDYKINDEAYIISTANYKVVQIKKNWEEYTSSLK